MPLTDESPMPFGKHKGESMCNVPAKYLIWVLESNEHNYYNNTNINGDTKAVCEYVDDNGYCMVSLFAFRKLCIIQIVGSSTVN